MTDTGAPDTDESAADLITLDTTGDGTADLALVDSTGDGVADAYATTDADGNVTAVADTDGDQRWDTATLDVGGDGSVDLVQHDAAGDGYFEQTEYPDGTTVVTDPATGQIVEVRPGGSDEARDDGPAGGDAGPDAQPFAPAPDPDAPSPGMPSAGADGVYGDGDAALPYADYQTENGFCAPVSVGMVIHMITGTDYTEEELIERAAKHEWLTWSEEGGWSGMNVYQTEAMIESFGIDAEVEFSSTPDDAMSDIAGYLEDGRGVIVAVDSSEVWTRVGDDAGRSDEGADHALVVTEVDPQARTVTLNDPGKPNGGAGETLTYEEFIGAWGDSSFARVVTVGGPGEVPAPVPVGQPADPGLVDVGGPALPSWLGYSGLVILPIVLGRAVAEKLKKRP